MFLKKFFWLPVMLLLFSAVDAAAHFGILIPSSSMVMEKQKADILLNIAFAHPFASQGMTMQNPVEAFVFYKGQKTPLKLTEDKYLGEAAFKSSYRINKPGVYQFAVSPQPYFESAEDTFIIHYAKTIIGAYGHEDGWNIPLGLPVEIIPLTRPFANYAGNSFTGLVLKDGKPLANATVEVEFLNSKGRYQAPNPYFETQVINTDINGVFTFAIPWAGWWGFAALTEGATPISHEGKDLPVELGGILWLEFLNPQISQK